MNNKLNTLLTTLYVTLVDRVLPDLDYDRTHRPGRRPALDDAELLCLAVAQHLLHGSSSESRWVRYARAHLTGMFPAMPQQSGYNKRIRAAGPLISAVITALAKDTASWHEILRLLDSTPVPCDTSRETVKRSDLVGHAGYGYCASHSRFFWGFRLYLVCTPDGMPVIWGLANPKIGERETTQVLLDHDCHLVHDGQVILADKGFAGKEFEAFVTDELGAHLVRPDRKDESPGSGPSVVSASGSSPSSTRLKANSASSSTAGAPSKASTPESLRNFWPWPPGSGTTGSSTPPTNAP
ncbi:putative transposase (plasmid) [Corynebacterium efficiens YS-314]|uniref:Putative transposase n=1 Tax=Corynebacterium efficiens (strain DSM 44549 / YS-314 / AJ 12310 / JCM 11189 / NBRC 100395) TaxID=196164 RepID=Q8FLE2_COREF|nr:putative transposase [Corynebacterium efficiens YS-314]